MSSEIITKIGALWHKRKKHSMDQEIFGDRTQKIAVAGVTLSVSAVTSGVTRHSTWTIAVSHLY